jgi:hypothetical protein
MLLATEKQEVLFVLSALTLNSSSCIEYSFKKFAKQKRLIKRSSYIKNNGCS